MSKINPFESLKLAISAVMNVVNKKASDLDNSINDLDKKINDSINSLDNDINKKINDINTKNEAQDKSINERIKTVSGISPDENGNVEVDYKNINNRPCYEDYNSTILCENVLVDCQVYTDDIVDEIMASVPGYYGSNINIPQSYNWNEKYLVVIDGKEYIVKGECGYGIGNRAMEYYLNADTGMDFWIGSAGSLSNILIHKEQGEHIISIYLYKNYELKQLGKRLLPNDIVYEDMSNSFVNEMDSDRLLPKIGTDFVRQGGGSQGSYMSGYNNIKTDVSLTIGEWYRIVAKDIATFEGVFTGRPFYADDKYYKCEVGGTSYNSFTITQRDYYDEYQSIPNDKGQIDIYTAIDVYTPINEGYIPNLSEDKLPSNVMYDGDDVILTAPNGTQYKLTVSNTGTVSAVPVTE